MTGHLILVLLAAMLAGSSTIASAQPRALREGTPLELRRERPIDRARPAVTIAGRVIGFEGDVIVTNVSLDELRAWRIGDGDAVTLGIGGRALPARVLTESAYAQMKEDPSAANALDVDILGVVDDQGRLIIVGGGGALAGWLRVRPGSLITIRKVD